MNPDQTEHDYSKPVAYDAQGNPLYAHPPAQPAAPAPTEPAPAPQVVHMARAHEPVKVELSPQTVARHQESKRVFPFLNLSEGEYVIRAVRRHPIGLIIPIVVGTALIALSLTLALNYASFAEFFNLTGAAADPATAMVPILLFCALVGLGMYVAYFVYVNNKFFLTNESVIQEIQTSLFSRHEQTVSLANIEDASYVQGGVIQHMFNYGSIRLSTEGDETTYRFSYVAGPKEHVATLNNAVEAFKNGRPIDID